MKRILSFSLLLFVTTIFLAQENRFEISENSKREVSRNVFEVEDASVFNGDNSFEQNEKVESSFGADGPGAPEPVSIEMYLPFLFCLGILGAVGIAIYKSKKEKLEI